MYSNNIWSSKNDSFLLRCAYYVYSNENTKNDPFCVYSNDILYIMLPGIEGAW